MKKSVILKYITAAVLATVLTVFASISVMAEEMVEYNVEEIGVALSLPSSMTVVTRSTSSADEALKKYNSSLDNFTELGVYLQAYSSDDKRIFTLTMNQDDNSKEVDNYNKLDDTQLAEIKESYNSAPTCESCSMDKYNDIIYFDSIISSTDDKGNTIHITQADTVVDGKYYHYILQSNQGEIKEEDKALMTSVLESVKYAKGMEKETDSAIVTFIIVVATVLGVLVVAFIIFMTIKKRRREATLQAIDNKLYEDDRKERQNREKARRNRNTATGADRPDAFFDGVDGLESAQNIDKLERELIKDAHRQAQEYSTQDVYDSTEEYGKEPNDYSDFLDRKRQKNTKENRKGKNRKNSSRKF